MKYLEQEIKFYINNLARIAERLTVCGADLTRPRTLERNLRMDTIDNSLQENGRLLRLRKDDRVRVTYKDNAQIEDGVITRTEIEFTADDFEVTRKFFEALGYRVVVTYEKYRRVFKLGDVIVTLDELPFGDFVEIEAPNKSLITGVTQMLGLDWSRAIPTNYLGLFEIVKKNVPLDIKDLTFEDFQGITLSPADLEVKPADV
jgi:adenylate cyclase, class 2